MLEEALECQRMILLHAEVHDIDPGLQQCAVEKFLAAMHAVGERLAHGGARRVEFHHLASFHVLYDQHPGDRQTSFARVLQLETHEIMPRIRPANLVENLVVGVSGTGRKSPIKNTIERRCVT